jgi:hypothetical protein
MQIGTLVKISTTDEIGIVVERVSNEFNRWKIIGLTKAVGNIYELSFPNKYVEVLCK